MDANDEKFFEHLTGAKTTADDDYQIELAKASAGVLTTAAARPKIIRAKSEKLDEDDTETEETGEEKPEEETAWVDGEPEGKLTVDVYQTPNEIVVESAIAGVKPNDIDVNVTTDSVTIRGSRKRDKTVKDEDYLYQECYWGCRSESNALFTSTSPPPRLSSFQRATASMISRNQK